MQLEQRQFHFLLNVFQNKSFFLLFVITMMTSASSFFVFLMVKKWGGWHLGHRQYLNPCPHVMHFSPSATRDKVTPPLSGLILLLLLFLSDWLTAPLKVKTRLMSWSLTEEMCLTLQPSCLPPPIIIIIIFSYLRSRRLCHSRFFWVGLEDTPAAVHPPFFFLSCCRQVKISLFQMWEPHRDSGDLGNLGLQQNLSLMGSIEFTQEYFFTYYRFS